MHCLSERCEIFSVLDVTTERLSPINSVISNSLIVHFTIVCLVSWPLSGSEAGVDLVLIKTLLLFTCKSCCCHAN